MIKKLRLIPKFMTSQTGQHTITIHILPNISRSKGNQAINFCQLIEYNVRNSSLQKSYRKRGRETSSRPLFDFFKKALFKAKTNGHVCFNI